MDRGRVGLGIVVRAFENLVLPTRSFSAWRFARASYDPLETAGSRLTSGRWHNCETTAALYTSLDYPTALAEYQARKREPFPARGVLFDVTVGHVFDLTDPAIAARLPFLLERCLQDTLFSLRRGAIVGDAAVAIGASGLLAPCMRGPAPCLCLYEVHREDYKISKPRHYYVGDAAVRPEPFDPSSLSRS